jgi:hypothetical protein
MKRRSTETVRLQQWCHRFTKEQAGEQDHHDWIERQINDNAATIKSLSD